MAVQAGDLKWYGCEFRPEDDISTCGGGISLTTKVLPSSAELFNNLSDTLQIYSTLNSDNYQVLTVQGIQSNQTRTTENMNVNGTGIVTGSVSWVHLEKMTLDSECHGSLNIDKTTGGSSVFVMESGILVGTRLFLNAQANPVSQEQKTLYDALFIKNTNQVSTLSSGVVKQLSEPESQLTFALYNSINANESISNRTIAPVSTTSFNDNDKGIPLDILAPNDSIQVWFKLVIPSGDPTTTEVASHVITGTSV